MDGSPRPRSRRSEKAAHPHIQREGRAACRRLFARLSEFLDGELGARDATELKRHLADCRPCLAYLESLRTTISACRRYGQLKQSPPPKLLASLKRLRRAIQPKTRADRGALGNARRPMTRRRSPR